MDQGAYAPGLCLVLLLLIGGLNAQRWFGASQVADQTRNMETGIRDSLDNVQARVRGRSAPLENAEEREGFNKLSHSAARGRFVFDGQYESYRVAEPNGFRTRLYEPTPEDFANRATRQETWAKIHHAQRVTQALALSFLGGAVLALAAGLAWPIPRDSKATREG